uniref:Uncharacterized protein n=1 Tax=Moorena producens (strain JHB) TaxID=1454205 RepID=A0A1D9G747_MOOP1
MYYIDASLILQGLQRVYKSALKKSVLKHFQDLQDPRVGRRKDHPRRVNGHNCGFSSALLVQMGLLGSRPMVRLSKSG